jgi:hypothetical protein
MEKLGKLGKEREEEEFDRMVERNRSYNMEEGYLEMEGYLSGCEG